MLRIPHTPPDGANSLYDPEPKEFAGITNPLQLLLDYLAGLGELAVIGSVMLVAVFLVVRIWTGRPMPIAGGLVALIAGAVILSNPDDVGAIFYTG